MNVRGGGELADDFLDQPAGEFFGCGVERHECELHALGLQKVDQRLILVMEHRAVIELINNGLDDAADVAEIEDHSAHIGLPGEPDDDSVGMPVEVLATFGVVAEPVAHLPSVFLGDSDGLQFAHRGR